MPEEYIWFLASLAVLVAGIAILATGTVLYVAQKVFTSRIISAATTECHATVARGHGEKAKLRATCVRPLGHEGSHATTRHAFEAVGFEQTPF